MIPVGAEVKDETGLLSEVEAFPVHFGFQNKNLVVLMQGVKLLAMINNWDLVHRIPH